jgi:hypothetical protein
MAKHCGRAKRDGTVCTRPQGWGIKGKKSGPCRDHTDEAMERMRTLKQTVLDLLADPENTLRHVAEKSDVSVPRMYAWRQEDEDFDKEWLTIIAARDRMRVQIVEDSLYTRAAAGKINPAEAIFFLKNRAPDRWRDKVEREITGKDGVPLIPLEALREILADDE